MTNNVENMEDVIRKVQKLFALANDGNKTSDESDTAMLMAQKLLAKHRLSMKDIEMANGKQSRKAIYGDGTEYTRLQWWMKTLAMTISENFKCYTFVQHSYKKTKIVFLGLEEDIELCKMVYNFAVASIKFHSEQYMKFRGISGDRGLTMSIKNDYISGYLQGLSDKFKEQVSRENWGLILVKDALVVKEYNNLSLKAGKSSKRSSRGDADAKAKGYTDGMNFSHGQRTITGK